jgi:septal ring factor EnvC (AmiA/AmiB activator)
MTPPAENDGGIKEMASLEIHAPGNIWGKITGLKATDFFLFVIVVLLCGLIYMVKQSDNDRDKRYIGLASQLAEINKSYAQQQAAQQTILTAVAGVSTEQQVTTWAILQDEKSRADIRRKLAMPRALKDRLQ